MQSPDYSNSMPLRTICMVGKKCTKCGKNKHINEYYYWSYSKDKRMCECKACNRKRRAAHYAENPALWRQKTKDSSKKVRLQILQHYSELGVPKCICCGEEHEEFLELNHINGGGVKHRKMIKASPGVGFYRWVIKNKYPAMFNIMCSNCNKSRGNRGYCPHEPNYKIGM